MTNQLNHDVLNQAIKTITRRDLSRNELYKKLQAKGFDAADIETAISYLIDKKWYSEQKAARELTESKVRSAKVGPAYISRYLFGKRFEASIIEQTVDALFERYSEKELAFDNARKKVPNLQKKYSNDPAKTVKIRNALYQYLARRGFSSSICEDVIQTVMTEE